MDREGPNAVSMLVMVIVSVASAIWLTWCTVIAFIGGTLPLIGWEIEGGFFFGLVWLFILDPIAMTVAYWASMLVAIPLIAISEGTGYLLHREDR